MPFPEVKRVIYKKNPLDRVICQLRFSPILKIDAEIPADFQEMIRADFPNYSEKTDLAEPFPRFKGQFSVELPPQVLESINVKNYQFSSEDDQWQINLTRSFLSLSTQKYERWETFNEKLEIPLNALNEIYSPGQFSRTGLRYINLIQRSALGLENVSWKELLQPYILGIYSSEEISKFVQNFESSYRIALSDEESTVRMVTQLVEEADNGEICYLIDSDFFTLKKMTINDATNKLDYFNKRASRLIQWCLSEHLHKTLEPQPV